MRPVAAIGQLLRERLPAVHDPAQEFYHFLRWCAGLTHEADFLFFRRRGNEPGLFVDVGGNTGCSALSFACMNSGYRIHSFEPNPGLASRLERVRLLLGNRFCYTLCALADRAGEATLFVPVRGRAVYTGEATIAGDMLDADGLRDRIGAGFSVMPQQVQVARLDDFALAPDIMKLDIQGSEYVALKGAERTIGVHRPLLLIEDNLDRCEVMRYLATFGYVFFRYDAGCDRLISWQEDWPSPNYFALEPQRHSAWLRG